MPTRLRHDREKLGTTTAAIRANDTAYPDVVSQRVDYVKTYPALPTGGQESRNNRGRFFGVDRGGVTSRRRASRGLSRHSINGDHPCPGPLFDWYRFAREVWDYWWYPFDMQAGHAWDGSTPARGYRAARRNTPVIEYY